MGKYCFYNCFCLEIGNSPKAAFLVRLCTSSFQFTVDIKIQIWLDMCIAGNKLVPKLTKNTAMPESKFVKYDVDYLTHTHTHTSTLKE